MAAGAMLRIKLLAAFEFGGIERSELLGGPSRCFQLGNILVVEAIEVLEPRRRVELSGFRRARYLKVGKDTEHFAHIAGDWTTH